MSARTPIRSGALVGALLALGLLALGLAGCVARLEQVTDLKQLRPNEVLLVGRIVLNPPFGADERDVNKSALDPTDTDYKAPVMVLDDRRLVWDGEGMMPRGDRPEYINQPFGETFFVKTATRPVYINSTIVYLTQTALRIHFWILDTGMVVEHVAGDRVVYVGTIRYQRNEFNDLLKVEVLDEYAGARRDVEKRFGKGVKLVKRLARPVPETARKKG
jgi:hypothetical protein